MHRKALPIAAATLLLSTAVAQRLSAQVQLDVFAGSALSMPLPMTIVQEGEEDLHFTAHWATNPKRATYYYAWRLTYWRGNRGWRFDHTHHKIFLKNPPPEVQHFRITNGFNLLTVSRAFRRNHLTYSIGAGAVVTFPYNKVRNQELDHDRGLGGYLLGGATVLGAISREIPLSKTWLLNLDVRGSASLVRVPVVNGHATVPNMAAHFHFGVGYVFRR